MECRLRQELEPQGVLVLNITFEEEVKLETWFLSLFSREGNLYHIDYLDLLNHFDLVQTMDEVDRMKNMARVEVIHPVKGHRFAIAVRGRS